MAFVTHFRDSKDAFNDAIASGRLSTDTTASNYAGTYMYMGTDNNGKDLFKNKDTRRYDV